MWIISSPFMYACYFGCFQSHLLSLYRIMFVNRFLMACTRV
uniref:Uncharacterized protein n=1 Tax=Rhizophora mucronata TaxID=61149 RepID=A0A2P2MWE0_RHIMU